MVLLRVIRPDCAPGGKKPTILLLTVCGVEVPLAQIREALGNRSCRMATPIYTGGLSLPVSLGYWISKKQNIPNKCLEDASIIGPCVWRLW